ncbi:MAG: acyl-CoA thioesterase, partial [Betaproteobacteria bacterium]
MTSRTERSLRSDYPHLHLITTRWHDNDVYGHVNNVQYYAFFDTTVNHFLLENNVLDFERGEVIGLVVETGCRYFAPISFPERVIAGLRVASIGNSSVRYEIGLFRAEAGDALDDFAVGQEKAIAEGH